MAKYLVTGGAGFIGSHLAEELLRRGHRVRVVDSLITGKTDNVAAAVAAARRTTPDAPDPEVVIGDLAEPDVARAAVAGMDYVLHQAAIPSVPRSVDDPVSRTAPTSTPRCNCWSRRATPGSSASSSPGRRPYTATRWCCQSARTCRPNPLSPYALQKFVGEQYMQMFTRLYGLETVTIRYFNVFGPRQDPSSAYSGVISLFLRALTEQQPPTIHGDGEQTRDFTYVANVVDGVLRAVETPAAAGEVINVATGARVSLNQLLASVQQLAGTSLQPSYGPARAGDVRDSQADIAKAERILGYRVTVPLDEGLRRTLAWFASTPQTR